MPMVEVTLAQGRTPEQLRDLIRQLTAGVVGSLDVPLESVRVVVREVPLTHWAAGDVTLAERRASAAADREAEQGDRQP